MLMHHFGSMEGELTSEIKEHLWKLPQLPSWAVTGSLLGDPLFLCPFGNIWLMHTCIPTDDMLDSNDAQFGANQMRTTRETYSESKKLSLIMVVICYL